MKATFLLPLALLLLLSASPSAAQPGTAEAARQVESQVEDRLRELELKWNLLVALFGVNLVGMLPWYFGLLYKANKTMDRKLDALVSEKPGKLHQIIDERDADLRLRRETPILVVATSLQTAAILQTVGFAKVTTLSPDEMESRVVSPATPVVFDLDNGCSEEVAASLLGRKSLEGVLIYSTTGPSKIRGSQVTYANSPITLFSRVMELIRYRNAVDGSPSGLR